MIRQLLDILPHLLRRLGNDLVQPLLLVNNFLLLGHIFFLVLHFLFLLLQLLLLHFLLVHFLLLCLLLLLHFLNNIFFFNCHFHLGRGRFHRCFTLAAIVILVGTDGYLALHAEQDGRVAVHLHLIFVLLSFGRDVLFPHFFLRFFLGLRLHRYHFGHNRRIVDHDARLQRWILLVIFIRDVIYEGLALDLDPSLVSLLRCW